MGVFDRVRRSQEKAAVGDLQRHALTAHADGDDAERDALMDRLQQLPVPGVDRRVHALRSRFARDTGDRVAALGHCREVVVRSRGGLSPVWARQYGRLLWESAAFDELRVLEPGLRAVIGQDLAGMTEVARHLDRTLIDAAGSESDPVAGWSKTAWGRVCESGTAGPFWLGAEHEPTVYLSDGGTRLLDAALRDCGAEPARLTVAALDGQTESSSAGPRLAGEQRALLSATYTGWVFSEAVADGGLYRQLVVWQLPGSGIEIAACWAVRGERYARPAAWAEAAEVLKDRNWRSACRRRLEVAVQAVACGVVPDASMLTESYVGEPVA